MRHNNPMSLITEEENTMAKDTPLPSGLSGQIIYAAKEFGPALVLLSLFSGFMLWRGMVFFDELRADRKESQKYTQTLTKDVLQGIDKSADAISDMATQTGALVGAIEDNTVNVQTNTEVLKQATEQITVSHETTKANTDLIRGNGVTLLEILEIHKQELKATGEVE